MSRNGRLFYGWIIVAVSSLLLFTVFGIRLSFSVFFSALIDEFGWTRADTSFIFSLTMIIFTFYSPITGMLLDRYGVRRVFSMGLGLMALGLFLSSRIQTYAHLVLSYGILAGFGITTVGLSQVSSIVSRWFERQRGLAIGLTFAGTGLGTLVIIPAATWVVENMDWRVALLAQAVLTALMIPLVVLFLRQSPAEMELLPDGVDVQPSLVERTLSGSSAESEIQMRDVLKTGGFWLLLIAGLTMMGPIRMLTVHQVQMMQDVGVSLVTSSQVVGLAGAITAVSFILTGALSDRIGRSNTYIIGGVCLLVALWLVANFANSHGVYTLWLYALLIGISEGSRSSLVVSVAADLFSGKILSSISGMLGGAFGAGAALFPWLAGRIYDTQDSYLVALWLGGLTAVISMITLWLAEHSKRI